MKNQATNSKPQWKEWLGLTNSNREGRNKIQTKNVQTHKPEKSRIRDNDPPIAI